MAINSVYDPGTLRQSLSRGKRNTVNRNMEEKKRETRGSQRKAKAQRDKSMG